MEECSTGYRTCLLGRRPGIIKHNAMPSMGESVRYSKKLRGIFLASHSAASGFESWCYQNVSVWFFELGQRCCLEIVNDTYKSNQQRLSNSKSKVDGLTPLDRSFMVKHFFHNLQCHHFLQNIFKRWPNFCFAMLKFFNDGSKRANDFDSKMEGQSSSSCQVHTSVPTHLFDQIIWRTRFHFFT